MLAPTSPRRRSKVSTTTRWHAPWGDATPLRELISLSELSSMAAGSPDAARLPGAAPVTNGVARLCWTSGTEAEPKGCPVSHNNWLFQVGFIPRVAALREGDRLLATAPIVNMTGVGACLVAWLQSAGILVLHRPVNMPLLLRQLTGHDVQFTLLAPTLLNMISKLPEADEIDLSSARTIVTGSAPPSAWIPEEFQRRGASRSPTCGARTRAPDWPRALRMYPS